MQSVCAHDDSEVTWLMWDLVNQDVRDSTNACLADLEQGPWK